MMGPLWDSGQVLVGRSVSYYAYEVYGCDRGHLLPVEGDAVSGVGVDIGPTGGGPLVADDIGAAYGRRLNEAIVLVQ